MPTAETYPYTLPSGATIEVENLPGRGAREVSAEDRERRLPLDKVLAPLGEVADLVLNQIRSAVKVPNTVTVELGAALKDRTWRLCIYCAIFSTVVWIGLKKIPAGGSSSSSLTDRDTTDATPSTQPRLRPS